MRRWQLGADLDPTQPSDLAAHSVPGQQLAGGSRSRGRATAPDRAKGVLRSGRAAHLLPLATRQPLALCAHRHIERLAVFA